jgi:hypothetical protein
MVGEVFFEVIRLLGEPLSQTTVLSDLLILSTELSLEAIKEVAL